MCYAPFHWTKLYAFVEFWIPTINHIPLCLDPPSKFQLCRIRTNKCILRAGFSENMYTRLLSSGFQAQTPTINFGSPQTSPLIFLRFKWSPWWALPEKSGCAAAPFFEPGKNNPNESNVEAPHAGKNVNTCGCCNRTDICENPVVNEDTTDYISEITWRAKRWYVSYQIFGTYLVQAWHMVGPSVGIHG